MVKMKAIEYNLWNTMIKLIMDKLPPILAQYNVKYQKLDILPAYPRDLTDVNKPSIIVRKVGTSQYKVSMDGFIGQTYDGDLRSMVDVKGVGHDSMLQFDVVGDSNIQSSLLASIISEEIFNAMLLDDKTAGRFTLLDFTADVNNPKAMGIVKMLNVSDIDNLATASNRNNDYVSIIRTKFDVIQTVVPKQEFVDLSKWIKITQTIRLKEE